MPVSALPPRSARGHITTYGQGRTCSVVGCETALSRYNKTELCWTHAEKAAADRRALS